MAHGIEMEPYGRKKFEVVSGLSIETCVIICRQRNYIFGC